MIEQLYRASQAGVDIDLVVRDICRLKPGLERISENIRVISIVNRFLEHSRIFHFHNDGDDEYYIGSADWMERNLDNRVEAVAPIHDEDLQQRLQYILDLCLADNCKSWEMHSDGSYTQRSPGEDEPIRNAQQTLMREATDPSPAHRR
jgi:polyphosphate kinase